MDWYGLWQHESWQALLTNKMTPADRKQNPADEKATTYVHPYSNSNKWKWSSILSLYVSVAITINEAVVNEIDKRIDLKKSLYFAQWFFNNVPSEHTTLFQSCNNVFDVRTTLYQRQNNVVHLVWRYSKWKGRI